MKKRKSRYSYGMALPAILIYVVFLLIPVLGGLGLSFVKILGFNFQGARFAGLSNYLSVFQQENMLLSVKNSFIFAIITTVCKVTFGLMLALALNKTIRLTKVLRTIFFFPAVINSVAVGIIFQSLMHPSRGLINVFLKSIGLDALALNWLMDPKIAIFSVCIIEIWKWSGYTMVIFLSGLQAISGDYYESAQLDGATGWKKFRYITFPLLLPTFNNALIINIIGGLKVFDLVQTTTGGGPGFATEVFSTAIYKCFGSGRLGEGSAVGIILSIVISIIVIPTYRFIAGKEVEA